MEENNQNKEVNNEENYDVVYYSVDYRLSLQHEDGTTTHYSDESMKNYFKKDLGRASFDGLFNSKEEAAEVQAAEDVKKVPKQKPARLKEKPAPESSPRLDGKRKGSADERIKAGSRNPLRPAQHETAFRSEDTGNQKTGFTAEAKASWDHPSWNPDPETEAEETESEIRQTADVPHSTATARTQKAKPPPGNQQYRRRNASTQAKAAGKNGKSSANVENPISDAATSGETAPGKTAARLTFEENVQRPPSKLKHPSTVIRTINTELHRTAANANEDENVAATASLEAEEKAESALRMGDHVYHARKYKRAAASSETTGQFKTTADSENPVFTSNPYSRWQQKRAIRKEYANARAGRNTASTANSTRKKAEEAVSGAKDTVVRAVQYVKKNSSRFIALGLLAGMLLMVMGAVQSCTPLAQSILESIVIGTYPATEEDVRAAERVYLQKERDLKYEMDHYETVHPGYDEYHVEQDEIWHNPYVLIAIISAYYDGQNWDLDKAMPVIEKYFKLQYRVTETIETETRYRTETQSGTRWVTDPDTGEKTLESYTYDEDIPYQYTICNVTLENYDLSHTPVISMSHHTMGMYALYMATHGNMEGIFHGPHAVPLKDPMLYDIPQETLDADPTFAKLMEEATQYIGYPYVWGGASPETSFDCSGFVSYVFTASGVYNTGRLGAKGLRSLCRDVPVDQAKPGDIVFFDGTMGEGVAGITHCGIYVGNNMMIHCGSPLGYANLNDSYWRQHFHSFGRVPN